MRFDRGAYRVRMALAGGDNGPAVTQRVRKRVDTADMVEQQKDERTIGRPRLFELRQ